MNSNNKQKILTIIPARMGSSRFHGKPMAEILGKPTIGYVYDNVKKNQFYMSPHIASTCTGFLKGCRVGLDRLIQDLLL